MVSNKMNSNNNLCIIHTNRTATPYQLVHHILYGGTRSVNFCNLHCNISKTYTGLLKHCTNQVTSAS
uniref:Uncharacterized protein n=1 Tax=Arundo donax TaxID=35708 RepID=A0A0A9DX87_ARUDO